MPEQPDTPVVENQDPPWPTMHPADDYDGGHRPPHADGAAGRAENGDDDGGGDDDGDGGDGDEAGGTV